LGQEYKVHLPSELLFMRPDDWKWPMPIAKAVGVRHFQQAGYRVFAFVDNEPDNLKAVSDIDVNQEILLLHANTIFRSKRSKLPLHAVAGKSYDLTELISEKALPQHIQFVWYDINDPASLRRFLNSQVHWGHFSVRASLIDLDLILAPEPFTQNPFQKDKMWHALDKTLVQLCNKGKGIQLDLNLSEDLIYPLLVRIGAHNLDDSNLWFSGNVEDLGEKGVRQLARARPGATIECPVDFLAPLICSAPTKAQEILNMFKHWGVNRFSISWQTPNLRPFFDQMDRWGFEVHIYDVPDLESFLQAVLLTPHSITSNFDFPKWHYRNSNRSTKNGRQRRALAKEPAITG
jgi:hypothetical protein